MDVETLYQLFKKVSWPLGMIYSLCWKKWHDGSVCWVGRKQNGAEKSVLSMWHLMMRPRFTELSGISDPQCVFVVRWRRVCATSLCQQYEWQVCVCGRRKTLFLSQHLDLDFLNCTPAFSTSGPSHYLSYVFFTFIPFPRLIVLCSDGSISSVIHHQTINANESVKRVHVSVPHHLRVGVPV